MATLNFHFTAQPGYDGTYHVGAFAASAPSTEVVSSDVTAPFSSPVSLTWTVPTTETHTVKVTAVACSRVVGTLDISPTS